MATDTKKSDHAKIEPKDTKAGKDAEGTNQALQEARAAQTRRETLTKIDSPQDRLAPEMTPEEAKQAAKETKDEHAAIETAATINQRLAKDGSANRVDVSMRHGKPVYRWGNFIPTRELTADELDAVDNLDGKSQTKAQTAAEREASRRDPQPTVRRTSASA